MKIWLTSDWHLFHKNIIKYCNRSFKDEYEMNETILKNFNSLVQPDDSVIVLGDIAAGVKKRNNELHDLLLKFNGNKILLKGNHDYFHDDFYRDSGFQAGNFLEINNFFLNHYPLIENARTSEDEMNMINVFKKSKSKTIIHGHSHLTNFDLSDTKRINVCVDLHDFKPIILEG